MNERAQMRRSASARVGLFTLCALGLILVAILIGMASLGVAAVFTGAGKPTGWDQINDAFGVVNSVFSALALIVVGLTLWVQYRELKMQRGELHEQRLTADRSTDALHKSAEADLRGRHVELLKMAIDDPLLAEVWPSYGDVSADRAKQFLYANLIIQHLALMHSIGRDEEYVLNVIRFCFSNPIVREFWERTMLGRQGMAATEARVRGFEQMCDRVYRETSDGTDPA